MSGCKKDKKLKKKEKLQRTVKDAQVRYDIIELLRTERQDSKPNLGKFLKDYVSEITGCTDGRVTVYPEFRHSISKVIVRFADGHDLLYLRKGFHGPEYYLYDGIDEVPVKQSGTELIMRFFEYLETFGFVNFEGR